MDAQPSSERARSFWRRITAHRRSVFALRRVGQLGILVSIAGALVVYANFQARREREARAVVERLGGRYNIMRDRTADYLPDWIVNIIGPENVCPVKSVSLANCDVADDDIELLLNFTSLEQINLCGCDRLTPSGLERLRQLPRLKLVWVDGMGLNEAGQRLTGEPTAASGH